MAQVILIEDNKNLRDILAMNLQTFCGADVIPRGSAEEAIELLRILPGVPLVITREKIGSEETAKDIYQFIKEEDYQIEMIVFGKFAMDEKIAVVSNDSNWNQAIEHAARILGVSKETLEQRAVPDYIPVPISHFYNLESSCCDVFIRIKKAPGEFQFIKRIHALDQFQRDIIQKYANQGLKNFYIPKDEMENFTNFMSNQLFQRMEDIISVQPLEAQIKVLGETFQIAAKEIQRLGFTTATIQLTEGVIKGMLKVSGESKQTNQLLAKLINAKDNYMYQHCHMTSLVASQILRNLKKDDEELHSKMAYGAFFKDITLTDYPDLARISTYEELENADLTDETWDKVFSHALDSAILIRNNPEAPIGVDEIIKNHHGSTNGKGFSTQKVQKLTEDSQIFLVACEFVKELLVAADDDKKQAMPIIDRLHAKYDGTDMARILQNFEGTFKKRA